MTAKHVSVAEAKAKFAALIDGVVHRGERYVIERHGREVAALVGVPELERLEKTEPTAEGPAGALAFVGLFHDVPEEEIDQFIADIRASRDRDTGRPVDLED